jgi:NADPH-dependent glutamate synthase beta subunit-like oxidoreductase/CO/xanthine dehydrogenase FAD-binding subunit
MKSFNHIKAVSFGGASALLKEHGESAQIMAGGTDLLGIYKDGILETYPETVVSIKNIPDGSTVTERDGKIVIGATSKLGDLEKNPLIREKCPALAQAARSVASPLIRNLATIGGNICQDVRCWYYRYPASIGGAIPCLRKGGSTCYAVKGENRYHSIFGGKHANVTPCTRQCPAGTDIPKYMEQIRKGDTEGAARTIMLVNPMPMLTSRVCAHFCQEGCNRIQYDESVTVGSVERFVGDYILAHCDTFYKKPETASGKKVAVIGSGPSGLSAAYYLAQAGHAVTVYDRMKEAGGMLMYAIPAYRLPKDLVRKFVSALTGIGIKFELGKNVGTDITPDDLEKQFDSIYFATGAWKRPVLGLAGEELTVFGLDFLVEVDKWMQGKVGEDVFVSGGGNVAMDVAITAKRLGAKHVTLACLEGAHEMPAGSEEVARAKEEGIVIMNSWGLAQVIEEGGKVQGMKLKRCVSVRDESGAFRPKYDENETFAVKATNILMAVGQMADLSFLTEKYEMQLDRRGLIDVSAETQMTSRKGVFAGGDVTSGPATVIKGIAAGHTAALGMSRYLGIDPPVYGGCETEFSTFDREGVEKTKAARLKELPKEERSLDKEDSFSLAEAEALGEAKRCMDCACYSVNPSDIATVLVMLDAEIVTTERTIPAKELLCTKLKVSENLHQGELVKEIVIPIREGVSSYDKNRIRDAIDFAIASLASRFVVKDGAISDARLVYGSTAPVPYPLPQVEQFLKGKKPGKALAEEAAELAVKDSVLMGQNEYKVHVAKSLVKQAVLRVQ